jgi:hypothetical protein
MAGYVNDFEETGIIGVLDYVDPTFAVVERYGPPVIAGTLVSDGLRMLLLQAPSFKAGVEGKLHMLF